MLVNTIELRDKICSCSIIKTAYYDEDMMNYDKNAVVFVHMLKQGGSQRAVESLISRLSNLGYGIFIISPVDGCNSEIFAERYNACVLITNGNAVLSGDDRSVLYAFDIVFINSICSYLYAFYYVNTNIPCIWWIHEEETFIEYFYKYLNPVIIYSKNYFFAFPWKEPIDTWNRLYPGTKVCILPIEVEDKKTQDLTQNNKLKLLIPGSYSAQKGFHVMVPAVAKLIQSGAKSFTAEFCGYIVDNELFEYVLKSREMMDGITVTGEVTKEELDKKMAEADCIVVPSTFDSGPLTAIEALMHEKILIVSDVTGASKFVRDCESAFVFQNKNVEELYKRLLLVYHDRDKLDNIRKNGRKVYEENFTKEVIDYKFIEMMDWVTREMMGEIIND